MKFSLHCDLRFRGIILGIFCALVCWLLNQTAAVRNLENWSLDLCFQVRDAIRGPRLSVDVVIVALDDNWFNEYAKPKAYISPDLAKVVDFIKKQNPTAIGVDLMVPDAIHKLAALAKDSVGDAISMGSVVKLNAGALTDTTGTTIVLPQALNRIESNLSATSDSVKNHLQFPVRQWLGPDFDYLWDEVGPTVDFASVALLDTPWQGLGAVNFELDEDNAVRRQELSFLFSNLPEVGNHFEPSFAIALVANRLGLQEDFLVNLETKSGDIVIPTDNRRMLINYSGSRDCFRVIPFLDVLEMATLRDESESPVDRRYSNGAKQTGSAFRNKIVLIGETYASTPDRLVTPFNNRSIVQSLLGTPSRKMPGVEVHAHTVQTILNRNFITTPFILRTPILLILWGALLGAVLIHVSLERGFIVTFVQHWMWKLICILAFVFFSWRIEMVAVLLLGFLLYAVCFAFRWRWIRRMMGMVKSEEIAMALIQDPSKLGLKGEEREITILFSDIRSFTTYSENHSAVEVVKLLNEYFAVIIPVIEKHHGVVNQYMGDGIMVLFNAPNRNPTHVTDALRAAIEMVTQIHQHRERWSELDAPDLRIGVGIHTGWCVIGTVGSPDRLDYSAIGDATNTSARIEAGNRELGTEILASAATVAQIPADCTDLHSLYSEGKTLSVKGKKHQLIVHEIRLPEQSVKT